MKELRWQDWAIVLLGVWLVLSPVFGIGVVNDVAAFNSYLTGTAVAIFASVALARPQLWEEYTNLFLGLWLIIAPFFLGFSNQTGPMWNQIIVGLLIGGTALAVTLQKTTPTAGHGHGHA
ncbi:MAG: SPW repeat protein [Gammaproteobacteria bacterium]|nr:MAG: SPW repeat protein [Gammaproteobacteria bacterium]